ncbi:MAG: hypothetical protein WBI44_05040 [Syntrophaceticus sp.]
MKHFNEKEWQMFRRGEYSQKESQFMEEHLRGCQKCMDAFLKSIDEEDVALAQETIPPDFTDTVISMIEREQHTAKLPKGSDRWGKSQNLFVYYAAAAILTITLMGGGAFQAFVKGYSHVADTTKLNSTPKIEQKIDIQYSKKIVDHTHQLIIRFENQEQKEVR